MRNYKTDTGLLEALENHGFGSPQYHEAMKKVNAKYGTTGKRKGFTSFARAMKKQYPLKTTTKQQ